MTSRRIKYLPQVGAKDGGHTIQWAFEYEDGSKGQFECPAELLSLLLQGLRLAGQAAEQARRGVGQIPIEELIYYPEATTVRTGISGDDLVLLFGTAQGLPVGVSIGRNLAMDTIQQIGRALALPAQSKSRPQ